MLIGAAGCGMFSLFLQLSASMPQGLWQSIPFDSNVEYARLCPPPAVAHLVPHGTGGPSECDGRTALLKSVVAREKDIVEIDGSGLSVNGVTLPNTAAWHRPDGTPGPVWPFPPGRYVVAAGEVWLIANHHPRSLDSRYFGPLPARVLLGGARPILLW